MREMKKAEKGRERKVKPERFRLRSAVPDQSNSSVMCNQQHHMDRHQKRESAPSFADAAFATN